ncbi:MAG: CBS domain-containing protein [Deltaproteobacteria bacterium]|nr:CBS domain-containing protein [Deltaproteobacteria bacterium]
MGSQKVSGVKNGVEHRHLMKRLLNDVRALERMLDQDLFESGVRRIGAEQEMFIVDAAYRPAPIATTLLKALDDPHFAPELALFNLEFNTDPLPFGDRCLSQLEQQLVTTVRRVRKVAREHGADIALVGILPTLTRSDLIRENMSEFERYHQLNDALTRLRGRAYEFSIKGTDELTLSHDSLMPEACNTSFQVHFQVAPAEFVKLYNIAQATLGPVLSVACNSPLLLGKRLWHETRIAVFEQAMDTRSTSHDERSARVSFGRSWVDQSVLEIFKEDVSRFRMLLGSQAQEDPFEQLDRGIPPRLDALCTHNSTVYRWNRVCYGVFQGKPHLRIENRVLPSGPTVLDQMANAAFWFGLMRGLSDQYQDITKQMPFDDAKSNFISAARYGLDAHMVWVGGRKVTAGELITEELLPLAHAGLKARQIVESDIDRYLGVIEDRVRANRTGTQWMLDSLAAMRDRGTRVERITALTEAIIRRQSQGEPVHTWPLARLNADGNSTQLYQRVEQIMRTDILTVREDDLIDLVAAMMDWQHVRYVLVENDDHKLVGLVSLRSLLAVTGQDLAQHRGQPLPVGDVMVTELITVSPETPTTEAIALMRDHRIGCLPVVDINRHLVGLVTDRTFVAIVQQVLEKTATGEHPATARTEEPLTPPIQRRPPQRRTGAA